MLSVEGAIDPVVVDYLEREIDWAVSTSQGVVIVQMDTPGGLMDSMHKIVIKLLNAKVPVVVYVAPSGARAASAGVAAGSWTIRTRTRKKISSKSTGSTSRM